MHSIKSNVNSDLQGSKNQKQRVADAVFEAPWRFPIRRPRKAHDTSSMFAACGVLRAYLCWLSRELQDPPQHRATAPLLQETPLAAPRVVRSLSMLQKGGRRLQLLCLSYESCTAPFAGQCFYQSLGAFCNKKQQCLEGTLRSKLVFSQHIMNGKGTKLEIGWGGSSSSSRSLAEPRVESPEHDLTALSICLLKQYMLHGEQQIWTYTNIASADLKQWREMEQCHPGKIHRTREILGLS